jgi:hypothetical protein
MGSKASCLAFLAGLAEGAFMLPSALLGFTAADGLTATTGADSTAVTAPTPKTSKGTVSMNVTFVTSDRKLAESNALR